MKIRLDELLDLSLQQKLLDSFSRSIGLPAAIIDLEGTILIGVNWNRICTDFHRVNEISLNNCLQSDTYHANLLAGGEKYSFYRCLNGLIDAAAPIIIQGEHIANAFIGQFLIETPDEDFFRKQARELGFDEKDYIAALREVPVVPEEKVKYAVEFMVNYAELLAESALKQQKQRESENELQEKTNLLTQLSTPIISIWESILAAPVIGVLDGERAQQLMEKLLDEIVRTKSELVLLDITGVPDIDTQSAQYFFEIISASKMLGSNVIITGISPGIAQTIVQLGIDLSEIITCASLATGMEKAFELLKYSKPNQV